jgi:hypothetical protein
MLSRRYGLDFAWHRPHGIELEGQAAHVLVRAFCEIAGAEDVQLAPRSARGADDDSDTYLDWGIAHAYLIYRMLALVAQQIQAFKEFPPEAGRVQPDAVLRQIQDASGSGYHEAVAHPAT